MYCGSCGSQVEDDSRFCTNCGAEVPVQPTVPADETPVATITPMPGASKPSGPTDHSTNDPSAERPASKPAEGQAQAPAETPKSGSSTGKVVAIVAGVVIVAIAAIIAAVMLLGGQPDTTESEPQAPAFSTEKSGDLVDFVIGKWESQAANSSSVYDFTADTMTITNQSNIVQLTGPYYLKGNDLVVYAEDSNGSVEPYSAILAKVDDDTMSLTDKDGTIQLRRVGTQPKGTTDKDLEAILVGYWDGYNMEGNISMTEEFLPDGTYVVSYNGKENADGGKYYVKDGVLYMESRHTSEPYEYKLEFLNDNKTMVQTSVDGIDSVHLNRASKPTPTEPTPAPTPEPAQSQSPYQQLAGTWSGSLQDGMPITYKFGADQHFAVAEDGDWFDDGPYTISGDKLILNGMNGTDTYSYELTDGGNSLVLSYPGYGAYFYFTRVG